ncbi:flagellar hook assembly protein FlgD [Thioalkalivibrio sp.]|uniref:flagellar hook assembly protein FlgD n=1 Tax=Thioalkalivibrio sp. TaxID=2093813 RepID=UPI003565C1D1
MSAIDNDLLANLGLTREPSPAEKGKDRLGQGDFLELMTTQLENQDPFQPMESGEFLGQLAQFGTVSGIEDLQKSFQDLTGSVYSGQALQAAGLVDREVMVPVEMSIVDPAQGQWGAAELPSSTSDLVVGVYDASGALVRRMALGPQEAGLTEFRWDGRDESGEVAPAGVYEFRAETRDAGRTEALEMFLASRVESVSLGNRDGSLTLTVQGLGEIDFSKVRRIG